MKTSLHESGWWHTAYFEGFFEDSVPEEDRTERGRFIDQWQPPKPIAPGVTLAYRIVTPWSSVTARGEESGSFVSVPAPPEGRAIEVDVFLLDEGTEGWPGKNSMSTELVGSYRLQGGRTVCCVWWEIATPTIPPLRAKPKFYRGKSMDDLKASTRVRMLAFGAESDGSKVIYDFVAEHASPTQMARSRPAKKREPTTSPAARCVLPMELQVGDRLADETGEREVIGRPYTTAGGKTGERPREARRLGAEMIRVYGAHERVAVKRSRRAP